MIREAIDKILSLAPANILDIGGRRYTDKGIQSIKEPAVGALEIHTLTGLVDYIVNNADKDLQGKDVFVHVESHEAVMLFSTLFGPFAQRDCFLNVSLASSEPFPFGRWLDIETFVIQLRLSSFRMKRPGQS